MDLNVRLIMVSMLTVIVAVVTYVLTLDIQYYFCTVGRLNVIHAAVHYVISVVVTSIPLMFYGYWLFTKCCSRKGIENNG